jgi:tRNA (adenine37-N6)-methyltransferase
MANGPGQLVVTPVAVVRSPRRDLEDDDWGTVEAEIVLAERFGSEVWRGLDEFSHIEVVFLFDRVDPDAVCTTTRRPRGRSDWPEVGIFAQRAKDRPNRIGVTVCELVAVVDRTLGVRGLDAVDGTPVIDVKPYFVEFGPRGRVRQADWATDLMARYYG